MDADSLEVDGAGDVDYSPDKSAALRDFRIGPFSPSLEGPSTDDGVGNIAASRVYKIIFSQGVVDILPTG